MVMNWDVKEWLRELQTHKSKLNPKNLKSRKVARFPFKVPKVAEVFCMSRKNLNPDKVALSTGPARMIQTKCSEMLSRSGIQV